MAAQETLAVFIRHETGASIQGYIAKVSCSFQPVEARPFAAYRAQDRARLIFRIEVASQGRQRMDVLDLDSTLWRIEDPPVRILEIVRIDS
jgi:hypothetical protein